MYRNTISQQCVTETNSVSWVNYTSKTTGSPIEKEIRIVVTRRGGGGWGMKGEGR